MTNKIIHTEKSSSEYRLPILPLRQLVLFPGTVLSVEVGRSSSLQLLEEVIKSKPPHVLVATQLDPQVDDPKTEDLCRVAVEADVLKLVRVGNDRVTAVLQGLKRCHFSIVQTDPFLRAEVISVTETEKERVDSEALALVLKDASLQWTKTLTEGNQAALQSVIEQAKEPAVLADVMAVPLDLPFADRLALLSELDIPTRVRIVLEHVKRTQEVFQVKKRIEEQVDGELSRQQREIILRQQMKIIQEKLGEGNEDPEIEDFVKKINNAKMPEEPKKVAQKQLRRLKETPQASPDYAMQRTYLEWLCDLPWYERTEDQINMESARAVLDEDHFGLKKVKKRILEYIAIQKLAPHKKGSILCLVGPPGVGKTSLGKSIARALSRKFVRISLGGIRDESEVRGHRRTYVGALPGRFIQAMKKAGSKNPVILLDEIDKLGADFRGDPSSALLEVLDPEQNSTFSDHYIELPFDLSEVIFITTANSLEGISGPLLDRMEVISIAGYTLMEKKAIAKQHLVPKQLEEHGLYKSQIQFTEAALDEIIEHYTKEAGVRNLEREIANILRGIVTEVFSQKKAEDVISAEPILIDEEKVAAYLGAPRFFSEVAEQMDQPGVATGLAWTPVGGDLIFIEATVMSGKGQLVLTGKLGDVMKESAQAALSWIRAHGATLGLSAEIFEKTDIHIHVPHGAMPKDGPSAGVTMVTALVSRLTGNRVRSDVAMTGEITLRGVVLPVGGIKEKVLAAHRAGLRRILLPERNQVDLADIPQEVRDQITFVMVKRIETVLEQALTHSYTVNQPVAKEEDVVVEYDPTLSIPTQARIPTLRLPT